VIKGAAIAAPFFFEDAYLPFFFVGFAVFFVAFFAMQGSCGFSQATAQAQTPMCLCAFIGISASWVRVKMNRGLTSRKEMRRAPSAFVGGRRFDRREIPPLRKPTRSQEANAKETASACSGRNDKRGDGGSW
jgi:hypothetical protein